MKYTFLIFLFLISIVSKAQDIIIKKDGSEIACKVERIGSVEIEYRRADQSVTGPIYTIAKSEVFMVRYKDGTKDVFNTIQESIPAQSAPKGLINNGGTQAPAVQEPTPAAVAGSNSVASSSAESNYEPQNESTEVLSLKAFGYGGSVASPIGGVGFNIKKNGFDFATFFRISIQGPYYDVYDLDPSGYLLGVGDYRVDIPWDNGSGGNSYSISNVDRVRSSYMFGATRHLSGSLEKGGVALAGYGLLGWTVEKRYFNYRCSALAIASAYGLPADIAVYDASNVNRGLELEGGVVLIARPFFTCLGLSYFNSLHKMDFTFGLGIAW